MSSGAMIGGVNRECNEGLVCVGGVNKEIVGGMACIGGVNKELDIGESEYVNKMFGYRTQTITQSAGSEDSVKYGTDSLGMRTMSSLSKAEETVSTTASFARADGIHDRLFEIDGKNLYEWDLSSFTKTQIATLSVSLTDIGGTYDRLFGISGSAIYEIDLDTFAVTKVATCPYRLMCCAGTKDAFFGAFVWDSGGYNLDFYKYNLTDTGLSAVGYSDSTFDKLEYGGYPHYMGGTQDKIYCSYTRRTSSAYMYSLAIEIDTSDSMGGVSSYSEGRADNDVSNGTVFRYAGLK